MSKILPKNIQISVKKLIYDMADSHGYMNKSRIENGIFMENLVKSPAIGDVLSQYMTKAEIKTYIKDAVLNRYAKDKTRQELSSVDELGAISEIFGQTACKIESNNGLSFYRLSNMDFLIISCGTLLKWETALRKALEFIARAPGLPPENHNIKLHVLLNLALAGRIITTPDRNHLIKSLDFLGIKVLFSGSR